MAESQAVKYSSGDNSLDMVIVGAGFGGMAVLRKFRDDLGMQVAAFEEADDVGGTWYWNRYPGARCDVPSLDYSYSFDPDLQQDWVWSERYAAQPEIERYAQYVADRFDLRRSIKFGTRVASASFDESNATWTVTATSGEIVRARYLVMATGGYSLPIEPTIKGLTDFDGELYYTSRWPHREVEFRGKRIGVVGTGSSGMQTISTIAHEQPEHLYVFQRTANFCVPANNGPLSEEYQVAYKENYADHREQARNSGFGVAFPMGSGVTADLSDEEFLGRMRTSWAFGGAAVVAAFPDLFKDEIANGRVAEYLRQAVRARVTDANVAELLCPKDHYLGSRRVLVESDYLDAFNLSHVTLVDVRSNPIGYVDSQGVVTPTGRYDLDMLVLATGFNTATGAMLAVDFTGRSALRLKDAWFKGPRTYLGMMVSGFPNMFMIAGPGSPGIRSQGILIAEEQAKRIASLVAHMRSRNLRAVDVTETAQASWSAHVADVANSSLVSRDETQYVGANVPGKPRVYGAYLGGFGYYFSQFDFIARSEYAGFTFEDECGRALCQNEDWPGSTGGDSLVTGI